MKLEDQCVSLELAKRLKELGAKQSSIFVWEYYDDQCHALKFIPYAVVPNEINKFQLYSAFTVAELGEMIPASIHSLSGAETEKPVIMQKTHEKEYFVYGQLQSGATYPILGADTEADARAKFLIYLLENGIIKND